MMPRPRAALSSLLVCAGLLASGHAGQRSTPPGGKPPAPVPPQLNLTITITLPQAQERADYNVSISVRPSPIPPAAKALAKAGKLLQEKEVGDGKRALIGKALFDNAQKPDDDKPTVSGQFYSAPKPDLPRGAQAVTIHTVRRPRDISRVIPANGNNKRLIEKLEKDARKMTPYQIFVYTDAKGNPFAAIDLAGKPQLVDIIPGLYKHERDLIKKIMAHDPQVRVLVQEQGRTPDLVIGSTIVEMKNLNGKELNLWNALHPANDQVLAHRNRHGLGLGAVAINLDKTDHVPVEEASAQIAAWPAQLAELARQSEGKHSSEIALEKIFIFAGKDMKIFVRQSDGIFKLQEAPLAMAPDFYFLNFPRVRDWAMPAFA